MKKTILISILALSAVCAGAQNVTDALRFSQNEYFGTARSMAMGNAFTALGGDLGSVGINPAGSAVNKYSQFTLTPAVGINSGQATYNSTPYANGPVHENGNSMTRFIMPNFGMNTYYKTSRTGGLTGISFGLIGNATNYYMDDLMAGGSNGTTSYAGYLASLANTNNLTEAQLWDNSYSSMDPYFWPAMVGASAGMLGINDKNQYVGTTQREDGSQYLLGKLDQTYGRTVTGNKYDLVFNVGFNFNDVLYLGANLGLISISYDSDSYIHESPVDADDFIMAWDGVSDCFHSLRFHESYRAEGTGIYGKFGFIFVPTDGLRIGGAVQTPVANYINETMWYSGSTEFASGTKTETIGVDDEYVYDYKLVSPYRVNLGIAYTVPGVGAVSADYEMCDYSTMKFKETNSNDESGWVESNQSIKDYAGMAHLLRLGIEGKLNPQVALRAGYNLTTSPERYYDEAGNKLTPEAFKHAVSLGVGYSSDRSFFCDLAARCILRPDEYIYPYPTYVDGWDSPEIVNSSNFWTVAMTFGWRF